VGTGLLKARIVPGCGRQRHGGDEVTHRGAEARKGGQRSVGRLEPCLAPRARHAALLLPGPVRRAVTEAPQTRDGRDRLRVRRPVDIEPMHVPEAIGGHHRAPPAPQPHGRSAQTYRRELPAARHIPQPQYGVAIGGEDPFAAVTHGHCTDVRFGSTQHPERPAGVHLPDHHGAGDTPGGEEAAIG